MNAWSGKVPFDFWLLIFYRLLFATGAGMVYNKISGYFNHVNTHLGG